MLHRTTLAVLDGPHELLAQLDGLFVGIGDEAAEQVAEVLGASRPAFLFGGVNVDLLEPLGGVHQSAEVHVGVLVLGGPDDAFGAAGAGEPDVGAGLLHGHHPRVDGAVVVVLALVAEGAGLGPALDDEVVGLLEAGAVLGGVDAALQRLDGGAADEAGDNAAAGVAVQHGDFFGHADGVVNGDDVAQNGNLDVLGELGDDGGVEIDGRLHAPVRSVMLVAHNAIEADLIGQGILLMVLVV